MAAKALVRSSTLAAAALGAWAACPFAGQGTPPEGHAPVPNITSYRAALETLDLDAVIGDVEALLTDSQACWPADFGNYGPFFIRLAWHCSGTYRNSDGRGGCAGGRQRFSPEADWEDNGNLQHARALLGPIKEKYGDALSWGDLFTTAGTAAIKSMGGPIVGYCMGRVDDPDGTASLDLGPNEHQAKVAPCPVNGKCQQPLGTTTLGLIYMNPEGPVVDRGNGNWTVEPDPNLSKHDVRDAFSRMGFDERQTVALIGGGHAFGKTHGACVPTPPATSCGTGMGNDTITSGFEGPWTTTPTQWSNEFFRYLLDFEWERHTGPGGHSQWKIKNDTDAAHAALMRLTTDMALVYDDSFKEIVTEFAQDQRALDEAFAESWFRLMTNGGKWARNMRCTTPEATALFSNVPGADSNSVPPPQPLGNGALVCIAIAAGVVAGALVAGGAVAVRRGKGHPSAKGASTGASDAEAPQPEMSDEPSSYPTLAGGLASGAVCSKA